MTENLYDEFKSLKKLVEAQSKELSRISEALLGNSYGGQGLIATVTEIQARQAHMESQLESIKVDQKQRREDASKERTVAIPILVLALILDWLLWTVVINDLQFGSNPLQAKMIGGALTFSVMMLIAYAVAVLVRKW